MCVRCVCVCVCVCACVRGRVFLCNSSMSADSGNATHQITFVLSEALKQVFLLRREEKEHFNLVPISFYSKSTTATRKPMAVKGSLNWTTKHVLGSSGENNLFCRTQKAVPYVTCFFVRFIDSSTFGYYGDRLKEMQSKINRDKAAR